MNATELNARLDAFLEKHEMTESEDCRLYRHNTRKGLAAEQHPEITALCRHRAMAAAFRIRLVARRIARERRIKAQREAAAR